MTCSIQNWVISKIETFLTRGAKTEIIKNPSKSTTFRSYLNQKKKKKKIQVFIKVIKSGPFASWSTFTVARSRVERAIKTRNSRNLIARYWPANGHVIVENMYAANRYCSTVKDNLDKLKNRKRIGWNEREERRNRKKVSNQSSRTDSKRGDRNQPNGRI